MPSMTEGEPDAASLAAARVLSRRIGRLCGGSTGTNMRAVARIVTEMAARDPRFQPITGVHR